MALWSTVIQRPGKGPHAVEERIDTRAGDGTTYLWCDCPAWKFKVSRGGCTHVQMAEQQRAAGQRTIITPMTPEEKTTIAAFEEAQSARSAPASSSLAQAVSLPVSVMLAEKIDAPPGRVTADGRVLDDAGNVNVKKFPVLLRRDLAFEPKFDGHRMVVEAHHGTVRLWGRALNDISSKWPEILPAFEQADGVFDGEVIVLGKDGDHTFNALQNVGSLTRQQRSDRVRFVVWDVLEANGEDIHSRPYEERRAILEEAHAAKLGPWAQTGHQSRVVLTPSVRDGVAIWNQVIERKLEGIIAKPLRGSYKFGNRGDWLKLKSLQRAEFVVLGYTSGLANDGQNVTEFGALLLGEHDGNGLRFVGKAGTGFTTAMVDKLLDTLRPLRTDPPNNAAMVRKVRTSVAGVRTITWTIPAVVATVEFQERGADGAPRFPAFKSYRLEAIL